MSTSLPVSVLTRVSTKAKGRNQIYSIMETCEDLNLVPDSIHRLPTHLAGSLHQLKHPMGHHSSSPPFCAFIENPDQFVKYFEDMECKVASYDGFSFVVVSHPTGGYFYTKISQKLENSTVTPTLFGD